jgi:hypothetical protein
VFTANTIAPNIPPLSLQQQHNQDPYQQTDTQEDEHQNYEDEIEAVI